MEEKIKKTISIKSKLTLIVSFIIIALSVLLGVFGFIQIENTGSYLKGEEALSILKTTSINIDAEKFKALTASKDENDSYYEELRQYLLKVKEATGLKYLYTMVKKDNDFEFIVDGNDKASDEFSKIGDIQKAEDMEKFEAENLREGKQFYTEISFDKTWGWLLSGYMPIKTAAGEVVGIIGADFAANDVKAKTKKSVEMIILIAILFCISATIIMIFILNKILKPLDVLINTIKKVAKGDLVSEISIENNDEIGKVRQALSESVNDIKSMILDIKNESGLITDNSNMVYRASEETASASLDITNTISNFMEETAAQSKMVKDISRYIIDLQKNTKMVASKIEGSQNKADMLKENTNNGVLLLFGKIAEIEKSINDTSLTVGELEKNMLEIRNFLETINKISEQTNLLALNAAIEAARAGEHGKGFAVVADEVRKLAEESKNSVDKISTIIDNMNKGTKKVVTSIEKSVTMVKEGTAATQKTNQELQQTNIYISDIKSEIDEISGFIINIDQMMIDIKEKAETIEKKLKEFEGDVYRVAGATEEQQREMEELKKLSELLNLTSTKLRSSVGKFIV